VGEIFGIRKNITGMENCGKLKAWLVGKRIILRGR
jgi:hypothetical protein